MSFEMTVIFTHFEMNGQSEMNIIAKNRILEEESEQAVLILAKKYAAAIVDADTEIDTHRNDNGKLTHDFRLKLARLQRKKLNLLAKTSKLPEALIDGKSTIRTVEKKQRLT